MPTEWKRVVGPGWRVSISTGNEQAEQIATAMVEDPLDESVEETRKMVEKSASEVGDSGGLNPGKRLPCEP